jgi:hypothetical protein
MNFVYPMFPFFFLEISADFTSCIVWIIHIYFTWIL